MADSETAAASPAAPEVEVQDVGPATKRLTITIPGDAIREKLEESLGALATETALPGFRKGRAPKKLLEKRFGRVMRNEAKNQLMADAYARAIEAKGIQPVGEPEPTRPVDELQIEEGKPLTFEMDVEVVPEFELPDLDGIEVKKPLLEITDEHVDEELQRQRLRMGSASRVDAGFQGGDRLVGHLSITKAGDEEPLYDQDDVLVVCPGEAEGGRGVIAGLIVEDLAARLTEARAGQVVEITTTGPEGHELEDLRGAEVQIRLRITGAQRPEPAGIEQLVEAYGLGSEQNLREQIRLALQHQRDQEQAAAMREQVIEHLEETTDVQLPEKLSAAQVARNLEGQRLELLYQGLPPEQVEQRLAEMRAEAEVQTRKRLKRFFILRRLADHYKVEVTEQEINGRLAQIAAQHGQRPDQLRAELARTGRLGEIARQVREHKAADRAIANARVEEISAEKWNKMVSAKAARGTVQRRKKGKKRTSRKKATAGGGS